MISDNLCVHACKNRASRPSRESHLSRVTLRAAWSPVLALLRAATDRLAEKAGGGESNVRVCRWRRRWRGWRREGGGGGGGGGSGGAAPVASAIGSCTSHRRRAPASAAPPPAAPPSNAHLRSPTLSRAQPLVTRPPAAHPPTGTGAGGVGRRRTRSSVYWWQGEGRAMGGSAVCGGARRRAASARASALSSARPERPAGCAPRHRPRYAGWGTRAGADGGRGSNALHGLDQVHLEQM